MKLTPFGKLFIALVIVAVAGYILYRRFGGDVKEWAREPGKAAPSADRTADESDFELLDRTAGQHTPKTVAIGGGAALGTGKLSRPLVVGINTWAGHAPGLVANGGLDVNPNGHYAKVHGLEVKFILIEDPAAKLAAFTQGRIDVMWDTVDSWANEASRLAEQGQQGKSILMQDWSRGGDGIVATKAIRSVEDLKGKRIATTLYTPSHWLLLYLLSQSGLTPAERAQIEKDLVATSEAPLAAAAFKAGKVDAAVTWEPDLSLSVAARPDAHVLVSTSTATHIIADTLVARQELIEQAPETVQKFVHGWFDGIDMLKADPQAAYEVVAKALKLGPDDVSGMLSGLKLTHFADNALFYGLAGGKAHYESVFNSAFVIWRKKGVVSKAVEAREWADTRFIASLAAAYPHQEVVEAFKFDKAPGANERAIVNKSLSIHFMTNSDEIMSGSYFVLDALGETMTSFGNTFLRIEGNTDDRGGADTNLELSRKRAAAVKKYLVESFKLPAERLQTVGRGEANPVASNRSEDGRAMNRRTDIRVVLNAQ